MHKIHTRKWRAHREQQRKMKKSRKSEPAPKKQKPLFWLAITASVLLLVSGGGLWLSAKENPKGPLVTVYKTSTCGCCKKWVKHLEAEGFNVEANDVRNLDKIKKEYGVAKEHQSCHTALVNGYVIEGHVPATDIKWLIAEKAKVKGLAVPGMPMGSPGMEGRRADHYAVLSLDKDNRDTVFNTYN